MKSTLLMLLRKWDQLILAHVADDVKIKTILREYANNINHRHFLNSKQLTTSKSLHVDLWYYARDCMNVFATHDYVTQFLH